MTELLIASSAALTIAGVIIFAWSILDTRRRYYKEYLARRKDNVSD